MGSVADLRKTTDQQFVNAALGCFKATRHAFWRDLERCSSICCIFLRFFFAFDHRNSGRSTIKDEVCSMEDYADDAAALLEAVMPRQMKPKPSSSSYFLRIMMRMITARIGLCALKMVMIKIKQ